MASAASASTVGRVVLQFDDGNISHYQAADTLEAYGFRGSFGVVSGFIATGIPWSLTPAMVSDMQARGHEIHDHTTFHVASFWCNGQDYWGASCDSSLAWLAGWGIATTGWNQPGGPGECFPEALRDTLLSRGYQYAAGRVGLTGNQQRNFHGRLRADPFSLGRGFVASWGYNALLNLNGSEAEFDASVAELPARMAMASSASAAAELRAIKHGVARGIAQGLTSIPLFHPTVMADSSLWALGRLCAWLKSMPDVQVLRMADAVAEAEAPAGYVPGQNLAADFVTDRDADGFPDGWVYTGPVQPDSSVLGGNNTSTTVYGPHPAAVALRMTFDAKVTVPGDNIAVQVTPTWIVGWEQYGSSETNYWLATTTEWQTFTVDLPLAPNTDRVALVFAGVMDHVVLRRLSVVDVLWPTAVRAPAVHQHELVIGPNPAGRLADVRVLATTGRVIGREIIDVRGQRVALDNATPAGVYFLRYRMNDGCVLTRKVVTVR